MKRTKSQFPFYTIILVFYFLSCHATGTQKITDTSKSTTSIVNEIRYSNTDFRAQNGEINYVDQFRLNEDQYLNIHFTLEQPLIHALRQLDSKASESELLKNGNFQFTFLVDGMQIYSQDLHPGAGLPEDKLNKLDYSVPLLYPEPIDYWGWYLWLRFMKMGGGEDALADGKHQLKVEIRTYLSTDKMVVGDLLATGQIDVNVQEIPFDPQAVNVQLIADNSGWSISKDSYNKESIKELNTKIVQHRFLDINSIVVVKNGELLIEEYFNGADRETLHNPRSVGKTIASTMMGIAIDEGHLKSENLTLKEFYTLTEFDNYHPLKEEVTLKSLLTMSSNFTGNDDDYESPGNEEYMYPTDNWVKFTLDLPINPEKEIEKTFEYFTAGIVVLGDVIHQSVPGGLVDYTDKKLFGPLGINKRIWQFTPQQVGNTAGGLQLRAVDFAKWGQVYKNKGRWDDQQLISESWVQQSLGHQIIQDQIVNGTYGYLFWNNVYTVNGIEYAYSSCSGNGGNKIYVFKDLPLVIVITASAYGMPFAHRQVDQMMERYILPAVVGE